MKANYTVLSLIATLILVSNSQAQSTADTMGKHDRIFPLGEKAPANNFTGTVWVKPLVRNDSVFNCVLRSVTFEPGARSNWHYHPAGQILLVIAGTGYYQEKGTPIKIIRKGDVIKCPPNVEHWHGASPGSMMTYANLNVKPKPLATKKIRCFKNHPLLQSCFASLIPYFDLNELPENIASLKIKEAISILKQ